MCRYETSRQLLDNNQFITDGGLETTLIFEHDYDLPEFAAFPLLGRTQDEQILRDYYLPYIKVAREKGIGFILESPTWRASRSWGEKLGIDNTRLRFYNERAIALLAELRDEFEAPATRMLISGCIGPKGDGYHIDHKMSVEEARNYHAEQIKTLAATAADMVSAFTINYVEEAIGITLAAQDAGVPVVISFTVETDGRLPSGQPLGDAILEVDGATNTNPLHYMINCAHPNHFKHILGKKHSWQQRVRGLRANASCKSHAELDEATELDRGNPAELGNDYAELTRLLPNLNIFGGCCGTDHHHVEAITTGVITHY